MDDFRALIGRLDLVVNRVSATQRDQLLSQAVEFFVTRSAKLPDEDIALFDDLLSKSITQIEAVTLAKIAGCLSFDPNAPLSVISTFALHEDIVIASPVLANSPRVTEDDLLTAARSRGLLHLLAIAERTSLSEAIVDALIARNIRQVLYAITQNKGARFSNAGFSALALRAKGDDVLTTNIVLRKDFPNHLMVQAVEAASANLRSELTAANPKIAAMITQAAGSASDEVDAADRAVLSKFAQAQAEIAALFRQGSLDENTIVDFASQKHFDKAIVGLSLLARVDIDFAKRTLADSGAEAILILAKLAGITWSTARTVLLAQAAMSAQDLSRSHAAYSRMSRDTARQIVAFKMRSRTQDFPVQSVQL